MADAEEVVSLDPQDDDDGLLDNDITEGNAEEVEEGEFKPEVEEGEIVEAQEEGEIVVRKEDGKPVNLAPVAAPEPTGDFGTEEWFPPRPGQGPQHEPGWHGPFPHRRAPPVWAVPPPPRMFQGPPPPRAERDFHGQDDMGAAILRTPVAVDKRLNPWERSFPDIARIIDLVNKKKENLPENFLQLEEEKWNNAQKSAFDDLLAGKLEQDDTDLHNARKSRTVHHRLGVQARLGDKGRLDRRDRPADRSDRQAREERRQERRRGATKGGPHTGRIRRRRDYDDEGIKERDRDTQRARERERERERERNREREHSRREKEVRSRVVYSPPAADPFGRDVDRSKITAMASGKRKSKSRSPSPDVQNSKRRRTWRESEKVENDAESSEDEQENVDNTNAGAGSNKREILMQQLKEVELQIAKKKAKQKGS
eukprot:m.14059 g.14059  ORF g.14059 m.14059 type:complete len:427 (-) comp4976_c0_seq1:80-1360(-)